MLDNNLIKVSASSVKTFEQCRKKYYFTYIERAPKKTWDHFTLGSLIHKTLELFHRFYLEHPKSKSPRTKEMKNAFDLARKEFNASKEIELEAFLLTKDYLNTLTNKNMLPIKSVEQPFEFEIDKNIIVRGFIDRIDEDKDGNLTIVDYKTNKNTTYLRPFQLSVYGLWLKKEHPDLKTYNGSYILLRHKSKTKDYIFNLFDIDKVQKELLLYAKQIKEEKEWSENPQFLCKYCDFADICPAQKDW